MFFNQFPYTDFHELNLDFVLKNYKKLLDSLAQLDEWVVVHQQEYEALKALYDQLENGQLPPATYNQLRIWINNNVVDIISTAIKTVHFDLTPDGHLRAIIPDSWSEIIFGTTGLDIFPVGVDFGHLTLTY